MGFIYTLSDPNTNELRYVGKTSLPSIEARLRAHCWSSELKKNHNHKNNWVSSLIAKGLKPKIELLEEVPEEQLNEYEIFWIAQFRALGFNLVNAASGGEGWTKGDKRKPLTKEWRNKIGQGVKRAKGDYRTQACLDKCRKNGMKTAKQIIDQYGNLYESIRGAARVLGLHHQLVSKVIQGKTEYTGGYCFKLINTSQPKGEL